MFSISLLSQAPLSINLHLKSATHDRTTFPRATTVSLLVAPLLVSALALVGLSISIANKLPHTHPFATTGLSSSKMASPQVQKIVDDFIASKKVAVISKTYCPYCTKAKNALAKHNLSQADYQVWEIEHEAQMSEIQAYLKQLTGASSVPRVFINGKFIGGGDDTDRLHRNGQLAQLLAA